MSSKKLCSLGVLDIELNLFLYKSLADKFNFDINNYNNVQDLKNIFYPNNNNENNVNYFDYLILSSKNNLINTLLFINRAYKTKTFIEFIMPNKLDFSENTKFVRKLLTDVCNLNYLYIIENKIIDIPSIIEFYIKIIDDETKTIVQSKYFELFEINDIEIDSNLYKENKTTENSSEIINNNKLIKNKRKNKIKIVYNFDKVNYFLIDLFFFKELVWKYKFDMLQFIYEIININKNIIFILIINDNCFKGIEFSSLIDIYKEIIELSDIIFCSKNELNYFFNTYNELKKINYNKTNTNILSRSNSNYFNHKSMYQRYPKLNNKKIPNTLLNINEMDLDLILLDEEKHRKNFPRISILLDKLNSATIYTQVGAHMKVDYNETFYFKLKSHKLNLNDNNLINEQNEKNFYFFIGGFLSRFIYNKTFRVCFYAGFMLLQKILKNLKKNRYYVNIDDYNVLVPNIKKSFKEKLIHQNLKFLQEIMNKEKGFILDCTNINESKIKNYNPLLDNNCASYLLRKNNFDHLKKNGFINKKGILLKDPGNFEKPKYNYTTRKKILRPLLFDFNNIYDNKYLNKINIFNTIQKSSDKISIKEIKNDKYSKTLNNFHRNKNKKIVFLEYQSNDKSNNIFKNRIKTRNNNIKNEDYSSSIEKTSKNFYLNLKQKTNRRENIKNLIINSLNKKEAKNEIYINHKIKIPKHTKYAKYLFKLYKPDFKFNDFIENNQSKRKKIKRTYSQ